MYIHRRSFLAGAIAWPAGLKWSLIRQEYAESFPKQNLKVSLNAYSFNDPLSKGRMGIYDMFSWCAGQGFTAVDLTAYYFPDYPLVPSDDILYQVKRQAFRLGLEISGTGVRNDFTWADGAKRAENVQLVKDWILAAEKMSAPVLRIFAGNQANPSFPRTEVLSWVTESIAECVDFGRQHGVIIGIQNHHDFVKTADQIITIMERIKSDWFGFILDTGSYRQEPDPYLEIEKTIPYAVNWQIKEKIFMKGQEVDIDMARLFKIIRDSSYQGYLPIETLGPGDPKEKILHLLHKVNTQLKTD